MEKIIVIGSNSFLGSHFIHHALSQGSSVLGLSHAPQKSIPFIPYHWKIGGTHHLALEQLDASDHPDKLTTLINDYQPDYVINCDEETFIKIHDRSASAPFVVSTKAVDIYGPGQHVNELIPKIILSILLGKKISLQNRNDSVKPLIHISDVVAVISRTTYEGTPGETYYFSAGHFISTDALVALICKRMNLAFEDFITIAGEHVSKEPAPCSNHPTSNLKLNCQPTIEFEKGIDSVIAWAEEWLPALKNHSFDLED